MVQDGVGDPLAPQFRVRIDGRNLPAEAGADVLEVSVLQDVEAPGVFTLRLHDVDPLGRRATWADTELFEPGGAVEVEMGYVGGLARVFDGEITGLELEFSSSEARTLLIRGHDRSHRLQRGHKTRTFLRASDSTIAQRVASEANLAAEVEDTAVTHEYVVQHNQTDLEFLRARAARIGYEIRIDGRTLLFRDIRRFGRLAVVPAGEYPSLPTLHHLGPLSPRFSRPARCGRRCGRAGLA